MVANNEADTLRGGRVAFMIELPLGIPLSPSSLYRLCVVVFADLLLQSIFIYFESTDIANSNPYFQEDESQIRHVRLDR